MPDQATNANTGKKAAFIWYHADTQLVDVLHAWVSKMGESEGISSRLMVRRQAERTTFMEIYEVSGSLDMEDVVESIERNAATQPWFTQLYGPRKAEIFVEVLAQPAPSVS